MLTEMQFGFLIRESHTTNPSFYDSSRSSTEVRIVDLIGSIQILRAYISLFGPFSVKNGVMRYYLQKINQCSGNTLKIVLVFCDHFKAPRQPLKRHAWWQPSSFSTLCLASSCQEQVPYIRRRRSPLSRQEQAARKTKSNQKQTWHPSPPHHQKHRHVALLVPMLRNGRGFLHAHLKSSLSHCLKRAIER